jgi:signal transduction histidine kinase
LDPHQIQKVLTNLLLNAGEAVSHNGEIQVSTERQGSWAIVSVRDNGTGMSPEFLSQSLFRPFRSTKKKGLGVGMFHSKRIVEAHSGRIEAHSELGRGTTFKVYLPLER